MIKNLQRAVGTTQDGIAGPATYTASVERAKANLLLTALGAQITALP